MVLWCRKDTDFTSFAFCFGGFIKLMAEIRQKMRKIISVALGVQATTNKSLRQFNGTGFKKYVEFMPRSHAPVSRFALLAP